MYNMQDVTLESMGYSPSASQHQELEFRSAVMEAWHWLSLSMLIMPAAGINGSHGWWVFTRRGMRLVADPASFKVYASAERINPELIHQSIRSEVWIELSRGQYGDAVFKAMRAVEERVRSAGGYASSDLGVDLVRKAFKPDNGPLADASALFSEREGIQQLFAGSILAYKNPPSHRSSTIGAADEAFEIVILASHLLRIIESRACASTAAPAAGGACGIA